MISEDVLCSGEVVTEFTEIAEQQTKKLTGIPIDIRITQAEERLQARVGYDRNCKLSQQVKLLNQRAIDLLNGFIGFKEKILREVDSCRLYTANYPLLIEHILREANHYLRILEIPEERMMW